MIDVKNIETVLSRLIDLLRQGELDDWAHALEGAWDELQKDPGAAAAKVLSMYGGMGSFNDLILYKNEKVLTQENNELDSLRSRLYKLCRG